jgi:transcriptional regulator with XRE-family HTH domain
MLLFNCSEQGVNKLNKIKNLRITLGLTVRDLSRKANVAVGYISTLENDYNGDTNPTKDIMQRIATALNTTVTEVFF